MSPVEAASPAPASLLGNLTVDGADARVKLSSMHRQLFLEECAVNIGYAEAGDPHGAPLIFIPGLGGGRLMACLFHDLALAKAVRIICIDRPGIGLSSELPPASADHSRLAHTAKMVLELADRLGLPEFQLMAHSCGALYALEVATCQHAHSCSRVVGPLVLLSPWVPFHLAGGHSSLMLWAASYMPSWAISVVGSATNSMSAWSGSFSSASYLMKHGLSPTEQLALSSDGSRRICHLIMLQRYIETATGIPGDMLMCLGKDPNTNAIDVATLAGLKVRVHHGTDDGMVPLEAVRSGWLEPR